MDERGRGRGRGELRVRMAKSLHISRKQRLCLPVSLITGHYFRFGGSAQVTGAFPPYTGESRTSEGDYGQVFLQWWLRLIPADATHRCFQKRL